MLVAVAIGFVIAVTHPYAGNLGGGGFIVAHVDGRDYILDARETAPKASSRDMYLGKDGKPVPEASLVGPRAAGVPGTVDDQGQGGRFVAGIRQGVLRLLSCGSCRSAPGGHGLRPAPGRAGRAVHRPVRTAELSVRLAPRRW